MEKFIEMGLSETALDAVRAKGFEEPTAIQEMAIPLLYFYTSSINSIACQMRRLSR